MKLAVELIVLAIAVFLFYKTYQSLNRYERKMTEILRKAHFL